MKPVVLVSPAAFAWLWRKPVSWGRRLALDGKLPFRVVRTGWGAKKCRAYSFDACVARWGDPDPDRLAMLEPGAQRVNQVDSRGGTAWKLYAPLPTIEAEDGGFARPFDRKDSARTDD